MRHAASATLCASVVLLLAVCLSVSAAASAFRIDFVGEGRTDAVETLDVGTATYFRLADLARAVGAVRHWNPLTGKATLSVGDHRIAVSADNPFARCDDTIRNLRRPVVRAEDGFWVPPAYVTEVLAWALDADIVWNAEAGTVTVTKHRVMVISAAVEGAPGGTALVLGLSEQAQFSADDTGDALRVLVRDAGLSDSLVVPDGAGVITGVTVERVRKGVLVTAHLSDRAGGYGTELLAEPHRIEILVERGPEGSSRAARLAPAGGRSQDAHGVDRVIDTVVVDPGHGGQDVGARGPSGALEKDVNLAFARELGRALEKEGFHVLYTREEDEAVPVKRRAEMANLAVADLFVSVHTNAWHAESAKGVQVSYRAPSPRALTRWRPRQRLGAAGGTTRWESVQDPFVHQSRALAGAIRDRVAAAMPWMSRGARGGDLTILSGCSMPAVMVEAGFATNEGDEERIASEAWRRELARSIAKGVSDFKASMTGRRL